MTPRDYREMGGEVEDTGPPLKGQWVVKLRITEIRTLVCEGGGELEVRAKPYDFCIDQADGELVDWEVLEVAPDA